MKRFILLVPLLALAACQTPVQPSEDSPYYAVPVGSRLVLNRPLTISPDRASVYIQRGEIVSFVSRDIYHPNCRFEVNRVMPTPQTVNPDEFVVRKVTQYTEVSRSPQPGLQVADLGDQGDQVDSKLYVRTLHLQSPRQPDVLQISCQRWDDVAWAQHLTIREIRSTLGEWFTLSLVVPGE